jgi:CBS domain-containing protein
MQVGAVMTTSLVTVEPDATVQEAINRMMEAHVGAVAVCDGNRLVGIFTERDVLRLASQQADLGSTRVREAMTTRLVTATPDVAIVDAAHLMGEHRIRHLPVVEADSLVGMIGIRDVLRTLVERVWSDHDAGARETAGELLRGT